eukprot:7169566-Prymnesium_polylepis.1
MTIIKQTGQAGRGSIIYCWGGLYGAQRQQPKGGGCRGQGASPWLSAGAAQRQRPRGGGCRGQ